MSLVNIFNMPLPKIKKKNQIFQTNTVTIYRKLQTFKSFQAWVSEIRAVGDAILVIHQQIEIQLHAQL